LRDQVLEQLAIRADGTYLDCTFGRGGHSRAILAQLGSEGRLYALDRDPAACAEARLLAEQDERFVVAHGCFSELRAWRERWAARAFDGVLLDLGVSSPQLDDQERGFSFASDGPLDMRMDPTQGTSAADWVNTATEKEMSRVLRRLGEEPAAAKIAAAICRQRQGRVISTTGELAAVIETVVPRRPGAKHPATRSFQAIRMHVNQELEELDAGLEQAHDSLAPGGRLCVISFHSLEDRRVKRFLRDRSRVAPELARLPVVPESARPSLALTTRAVRPTAEEVAANPRARSATLRAARRL
jgi:16S rRNA (cytosine1402-N4)-methyltransferase